MRTTKRFTPIVLKRFEKRKRGTGIYAEFSGWHQVTRSDPSSHGQSSIIPFKDRQHDLLSVGEKVGFLFSMMLRLRPNGRDLLEQFPLSLDSALHELTRYTVKTGHSLFPGTVQLAEKLSIKHPVTTGEGETVEWIPSTDLIVVEMQDSGEWKMIAVSVKDDFDRSKKRMIELLRLEREYWVVRNVEWLLITPEQYDLRVARTLRRHWPWLIHQSVKEDHLNWVALQAPIIQGMSLTQVYATINKEFGNLEYTKSAWWQAVWRGLVPMDLRRDWRPHHPVTLLSKEAFDDLNPILARRSAWIQ